MSNKKNLDPEKVRDHVSALRHMGYAVVIFAPNLLENVNRQELEERLTQEGMNIKEELAGDTYYVVKVYSGPTDREVIATGLSRDEAKEMVQGPETSGVLPSGEKWMYVFDKE